MPGKCLRLLGRFRAHPCVIFVLCVFIGCKRVLAIAFVELRSAAPACIHPVHPQLVHEAVSYPKEDWLEDCLVCVL